MSVYESFNDIRVSLLLFKGNWKVYAFMIFGSLISLFLFYNFYSILFLSFSPRFFIDNRVLSNTHQLVFAKSSNPSMVILRPNSFFMIGVLGSLFTIIIFLLCNSFMLSSFGLANDIINSGDQFTEFNNSINYFKKNFFNYMFISSLLFFSLGSIALFFSRSDLFEIFDIFDIIVVLTLIISIVSFLLIPFTNSRSFNSAIRKIYTQMTHNPLRVLMTFILSLPVYLIPQYLMYQISIILLNFLPFLQPNISIFFYVIPSLLLLYPFLALIVTRIYAKVPYT